VSALAAFVRALSARADAALAIAETVPRELAAHPLAVRVADPALRPLLDALPARASSTVAPAWAIALWSGAAHAPPAPPWPTSAYGTRGAIAGLTHGPIRASFELDAGLLGVMEVATRRAWLWLRDADALPWYLHGAPFLSALSQWAQIEQLTLAHAAAVANDDGAAALLVGRGGSGKSTSALAAWLSGFHLLGDDYVLLDQDHCVHALYRSSKVTAQTLDRLPALKAYQRIAADAAHKAVLTLAQAPRLAASAPLRAVLVPEIRPGQRSALAPISAAQALRALAPSTLLQLPGGDATALAALGSLVRARRCFALTLGDDFAATPKLIAQALA
jgi:hypothetical protein